MAHIFRHPVNLVYWACQRTKMIWIAGNFLEKLVILQLVAKGLYTNVSLPKLGFNEVVIYRFEKSLNMFCTFTFYLELNSRNNNIT